MEKLIIEGGVKLTGEISIAGSKKAALPILSASLLTDQTLKISNLPQVRDVDRLFAILRHLGVRILCSPPTNAYARANCPKSLYLPSQWRNRMRDAIHLFAPMLLRYGRAELRLPEGCGADAHPIDMIISGLRAMGANVHVDNACVTATARRLRGAYIKLPIPSVKATETLLTAAVLARGVTHIANAAREPEVVDLVHCLNRMGADIQGEGTSSLTITGVKHLGGAHHRVLADRVEAGTYLVAAAATGGNVKIVNTLPETLTAILEKLEQAGATLETGPDWVTLSMAQPQPRAVDIVTAPYPAFPTDLQAQFAVLNTVANGNANITETVFENRFTYVEGLRQMGANIDTEGSKATIQGGKALQGTELDAVNLNAGACLVLAALVARGQTIIQHIHHMDRGFTAMDEKLTQLGARVSRAGNSAPQQQPARRGSDTPGKIALCP